MMQEKRRALEAAAVRIRDVGRKTAVLCFAELCEEGLCPQELYRAARERYVQKIRHQIKVRGEGPVRDDEIEARFRAQVSALKTGKPVRFPFEGKMLRLIFGGLNREVTVGVIPDAGDPVKPQRLGRVVSRDGETDVDTLAASTGRQVRHGMPDADLIIQREALKQLRAALAQNREVHLWGASGTGKTLALTTLSSADPHATWIFLSGRDVSSI
jgi:hypothetical protein